MKELEELRLELDSVDAELMRLFEKRMELSERIGAWKRANGKPVCDPAREEEVVASRTGSLPEKYRECGENFVRALMEQSKRIQRRGGNLYLIGMPDSGKTRMGKKLAGLLDMPLVDTDKLIMERTGMSIDAIFAAFGEAGFRDMEKTVLRSAAKRGGMIIATGGGMPMDPENAVVIRASGFCVFLDRDIEKLVGQSTLNRPLLRAETAEESEKKLRALYEKRRESYYGLADAVLDPDEAGAAERAAEAYLNAVK